MALPHPGVAIYRNCIELEINLASTGDKTGLGNARKLFEYALATYDQDVSLWRDYHSMEVKVISNLSSHINININREKQVVKESESAHLSV